MVNDPFNTISLGGDSNKSTFDFSLPPIKDLLKVEIPVLVTYGTKDYAAPFNDYLRLKVIEEKKKNFTFISYIGLEHNYFGFTDTGEIDYEEFGWDKVVLDWKKWLLGY